MSNQGPRALDSASTPGLSRRSLLRMAAVAGVAVSGGAVLSACSDSDSNKSVDVTLKLGGTPDAFPYTEMPSADERAKSPVREGYAVALQAWLDKNPGVKFSRINQDIWNADAMKAAIAGDTAPAMYIGNAVAQWTVSQMTIAFGQGLVADVAGPAKKHGYTDNLTPAAKPTSDFWTAALDGKLPGLLYETLGVGQGFYLRKDLLEKAGVQVPEVGPDWNIDKWREIAKAVTSGPVRGVAMPTWGIWPILNQAGVTVVTDVPDPKSNWNVRSDWTYAKPSLLKALDTFRAMKFEDKSVLSDASFAGKDDALRDAFVSGKVAMWLANPAQLFANPADPSSMTAVAKKLGKPLEQVITWVPFPIVEGLYSVDSKVGGAMVSFAPSLSKAELDKAVSLHAFMLREGVQLSADTIYAKTKDLKDVYGASPSGGKLPVATVVPILNGPKLPGSLEEAYPGDLLKGFKADLARPAGPLREQYAVETNPGPPNKAWDDLVSTLHFNAGADVRGEVDKAVSTWNSQSKGFKSAIDDGTFKKNMTNYYAALDAYWKTNGPDFHANTFAPFYANAVKPALA
ncbi:ABC transporter substrate-binding protein [Micromonospora sp. NPDC051300]|uniref:ABC transporter substrate-binding protein n=1 Tax=Micromonospora sp. NPDC051300 TaxID=3364286 RepID=UPI0037A3C8D6